LYSNKINYGNVAKHVLDECVGRKKLGQVAQRQADFFDLLCGAHEQPNADLVENAGVQRHVNKIRVRVIPRSRSASGGMAGLWFANRKHAGSQKPTPKTAMNYKCRYFDLDA